MRCSAEAVGLARTLAWALACACMAAGSCNAGEPRPPSSSDVGAAGIGASATACRSGSCMCTRDSDCVHSGHACLHASDPTGTLGPVMERAGSRLQGDTAFGLDAGPEDDADAGQRTLPARTASGYCDTRCDTRLCPGDQVCSSETGDCMTGCDAIKPCADPALFCDVWTHRCLPESGACDTRQSCPGVRVSQQAGIEVACEERACRYHALSSARVGVPPLAAESDVRVDVPIPGQRFAAPEAIEFRIRPQTRSSMLIVTRSAARSARELREQAIWWAFLAEGAAPYLTWQQGNGVQGERWDLPPAPPPLEAPLYLVVEGYERGELRGISGAIPFAVGKPYPVRGAACEDAPLSCNNQREALTCVEGVCMRICGSGEDCRDLGVGCVRPSLPASPYRVCR